MKPFKKNTRPIDPLALKFKKREGIDKYGKTYYFNGDIEKPDCPVYIFKLSEKASELLNTLKELFPIVFSKDEPKPFMCGFYKAIKDILTEKNIAHSSKNLSSVLRHWTGTMQYKKALIQSKYRYTPLGEEIMSDIITKDQKHDALHALQFFQQQFEWNRYMDKKTQEKLKKKAKPNRFNSSKVPKVPKDR